MRIRNLSAMGAVAFAAILIPLTEAKRIAFANGTTLVVEYGGSTMREAQAFYAPRFNLSVGGGYLKLSSDEDGRARHRRDRQCRCSVRFRDPPLVRLGQVGPPEGGVVLAPHRYRTTGFCAVRP